jgi:hypothetical protein
MWAQKAVELGAFQGVEDLETYRKMAEETESSPSDFEGSEVFETLLGGLKEIAFSPPPTFHTNQQYPIEELEQCGTVYAHKLLKIHGYCMESVTAFVEGNPIMAASLYAKAIRKPSSDIITSLYYHILEPLCCNPLSGIPALESDLLKYTSLQKKTDSFPALITAGLQYLAKHPTEVYFLSTVGHFYAWNQEHEKALQFYWKALPLCTKQYHRTDIIYSIATLERTVNRFESSTKHYAEFLQNCVEGHRKIPKAYLGMAANAKAMNQCEKSKEFFEKGRRAESLQHELFKGPTSTKIAQLFQKLDRMDLHPKKKATSTGRAPKKETIAEILASGSWLNINETERIHLLNSFLPRMSPKERGTYNQNWVTEPPQKSLKPVQPNSTPIFLEDMKLQNTDKVYFGRHLNCIILSIPNKVIGYHMVIADAQGNLMKLAVYNLKKKKSVLQFAVGQEIVVPNPYYRLASDMKTNNIRVDNPVHLVFQTLWKCCFYCFKVCEELKKCSACSVTKYCTRECQIADWKFRHRLECEIVKEEFKAHDK